MPHPCVFGYIDVIHDRKTSIDTLMLITLDSIKRYDRLKSLIVFKIYSTFTN